MPIVVDDASERRTSSRADSESDFEEIQPGENERNRAAFSLKIKGPLISCLNVRPIRCHIGSRFTLPIERGRWFDSCYHSGKDNTEVR